MKKLSKARVLLFGLGGVGGAAAEALARSGVGHIDVVDSDCVSVSNINRQLLALSSTVGMKKTEAARRRMLDISPSTDIGVYDMFVSAENIDVFDFSAYDYVIDAIDTVSSKLLIAERCTAAGTPLISSMGTGNKLDPTQLCVGDIFETSGCPLARVVRRELKKRGIRELKVVWSPEEPKKPLGTTDERKGRGVVPGTVSFVPPVAGYMLASAAVRHITGV